MGLVNATLQGGTLNTLAGGTIDTVGGTTGTLDGSTNGALAISSGSTYTASDGATTDILGTIANAGAIEVNGGAGANGFLNLTLNVTLNGGGTVTLSTATGGGNAFEGNGATLTNVDNTIQGSGVIGNGSLAVINHGLIYATPSGGTSTLIQRLGRDHQKQSAGSDRWRHVVDQQHNRGQRQRQHHGR